MASYQNSARQGDGVETTFPDQGPSAANTGFLEHSYADETLSSVSCPADHMASETRQELSNFADLHLDEVKTPNLMGALQTLEVQSIEDSAIIHSEMAFDPENTPRDPIPQESHTHSITSMCSEDLTTDHIGRSVSMEISLGTVPLEILLHICEFLEAGVIISTLSKVCQAFHDLFTNEAYWQVRMAKRWPKKYPPVDCKSLVMLIILQLNCTC